MLPQWLILIIFGSLLTYFALGIIYIDKCRRRCTGFAEGTEHWLFYSIALFAWIGIFLLSCLGHLADFFGRSYEHDYDIPPKDDIQIDLRPTYPLGYKRELRSSKQ